MAEEGHSCLNCFRSHRCRDLIILLECAAGKIGGAYEARSSMFINPVLFRSVTEGQLCLSTALAVNLLVLFRICAAVAHAVALLRRVLLTRAAPFSVLRLLRCFVLFHFCSSGA